MSRASNFVSNWVCFFRQVWNEMPKKRWKHQHLCILIQKMWHHTMCSREITCYLCYLLLLVSVKFVDRGYTCVRSVLQCMYMSMKRRIFSLFQNESILRLILQALIKQAQQIINMFQSFMNLKRTEMCSVVRLLSFNRYLYHKIHLNILCICFKH